MIMSDGYGGWQNNTPFVPVPGYLPPNDGVMSADLLLWFNLLNVNFVELESWNTAAINLVLRR